MTISAFELFKVGIGPSSSHTVGPMRAAATFVAELRESAVLDRVTAVCSELYGSLAATGRGHGTVTAVILGLEGADPETIDPDVIEPRFAAVESSGRLRLNGVHEVRFSVTDDVLLHLGQRLPYHSNGMRFTASDEHGDVLMSREYYSVGGGFVVSADDVGAAAATDAAVPPHEFASGRQLLAICAEAGLSVSELTLANEMTWRSEAEVRSGLLHIWAVMQQCVERGMAAGGLLPGGLGVRRRAATLLARLQADADERDPLRGMEWVSLYALAVNEENAAGGRVVTAPTNGAAGIVPAVLHYCRDFIDGFNDADVVRFLLTASAIGSLFKANASISGAEVGCQGEVGSACAMAAAGLAEVLGGTPAQVENAAEIGIEHNLGLTCDPVGGLVQIPCIERNAVGAIKAIAAARMAVRGDGVHHVSLDSAIKTMRDTGADMADEYKETSLGGLAVNIAEC
ncbi:L-serine ammonia-lyase [Mycobacterium sp. 852013-50091_SCH5140682]|uniref:L-serine ammonia-lyase n=1 Tax=Mycobacterium sp. 852013-50091_SCH5140682 TaxID=1834109 RepID=UPI0007EBD1A2|nr:L-serine ammonia-lyase [Mycobacterium sp. 852013-50091_SCH5140682]OBC00974.1 L-serine ammonia-lyase [Mycobacterium sp. 852013-50091_SCH5140682]